jgi:hypothetical protein
MTGAPALDCEGVSQKTAPRIAKIAAQSELASLGLTASPRPGLRVLGIEFGNTGAVALIGESGELLEVWDIPCLADGPKGRPAVNGPLLAEIIFKAKAARAYVEFVRPRPGEGAVQSFAFGRCRGVLEGILAAGGVPVAFLMPPAWKRLVGIAPGKAGAKEAARREASRRWPSKATLFARAKDDGRAEACLIAAAGLMRAERAIDVAGEAVSQKSAPVAKIDAKPAGAWRCHGEARGGRLRQPRPIAGRSA